MANFDDKEDVNIEYFILNLYKDIKSATELQKLK